VAERQAIHAVHADDREEFLGRLSLLDSFRSGELKCSKCEQPVRERGLGIVRMNAAGEIEVACADATCATPIGGRPH
jgi:hypothetical protein